VTDKTRRALDEAEACIDAIRKLGGRKGKVTIYVEEGEPTGVSIESMFKPIGTCANSRPGL